MIINKGVFGGIVLTDENSQKFLQYMNNHKSNEKTKEILTKGREVFKLIEKQNKITKEIQ